MYKKIRTIGEPVYENGLFHGICGIVYKKKISDEIKTVQERYLALTKKILLEAAEKELLSTIPGGWYYGTIFGAYANIYVDSDTHVKLSSLKRLYRKEVKDIIVHNSDDCYTYDWTMSDYEKGKEPAYVHYTNPYDPEGYGSWKPDIMQRLRYIEPSAKIQDKGIIHLWTYNTIGDKIRSMKVNISKYKDFYISSCDGAKELAQTIYTEKYTKTA